MSPIDVVLADDQTLVRDGLQALLSLHPDIQVVATARNGAEACKAVAVHHPQVVLMDIRMPVMDGIEATRRIKRTHPDTVIIILTTFEDDASIIEAMSNGAAGYLLKDISSEKLVQAIRDGVTGNIILPGRIAARITAHLTANSPTNMEPDADHLFTEREIDIIRLMVQGASNQEIAKALFLSLGTVKNYVSQIYLKMGVNDRTQAVIRLKRMGF